MLRSTHINILGIPVFESERYLVYLTGHLITERLIPPQILDALSIVRPSLLREVSDTDFLCVLEIQMFMLPTLVTMTIAATRMYRFLAEYCSHSDVCVILPFYYSPCSLQSM